METKLIILISGKRKSGKDFLTEKIINRIGEDRSEIIRITEPIKSHWAAEKQLSLQELLSDGPLKESYRREMIKWSDSIRAKNSAHFCEMAFDKASKVVVVVSDIRRKTDLQYFHSLNKNLITVRIVATDDERIRRGWKFQIGVDDHQSECDLDDYNKWDFIIDNSKSIFDEHILDDLLNYIRDNIRSDY